MDLITGNTIFKKYDINLKIESIYLTDNKVIFNSYDHNQTGKTSGYISYYDIKTGKFYYK